MAVFAVVAISDAAKMSVSISRKLQSQDYHKVDESTWLVSPPQHLVTPKEVSDFLDVTNGGAGRAIVLLVSSYYGYHMKNTWDWLVAKGV